MPYVLTNYKNWLMYNAAKQFTATPDVKQAQQFATEARAENARYTLSKPLKNLGYHVQGGKLMKELHWNKYNAAADLDPFPDIRYQCPVCYKSFKEEYDECPNCGLVMKRTCDNCNKVHCVIDPLGSGGCHWEKKEE